MVDCRVNHHRHGSSSDATGWGPRSRACWGHCYPAAKQNHASTTSRRTVFVPWSTSYKVWWGCTVVCSVVSFFKETYMTAFAQTLALHSYFFLDDAVSMYDHILATIFVADMGINFNLAYYNEKDELVHNRRLIARRYTRFWFWVDLVGVFPFHALALTMAGHLEQDSKVAQYLALLRLLKLVRLYRVYVLFETLQYSSKISLLWLTMMRNFSAILVWTHFNACVLYFIARQHNFDPQTTWIGKLMFQEDLNTFDRYITSLYWSVVTYTTVGYGDFSPANTSEQIWGMIYMLLNIIAMAWIIGSMTLLVVKGDEKTVLFRETMQTLDRYSTMNGFDPVFQRRLKKQLSLGFHSREISDEQVLQHLPSSLRRSVLRRLYLPSLQQSSLMQGIRQQFLDAFLATCSVEIFSPGEEILQRGSMASDLYLLVDGSVELLPFDDSAFSANPEHADWGANTGYAASGTESNASTSRPERVMGEGNFVNEFGFFTESPQFDTVRTITVCKFLTISRSAYHAIAQNHPGSAGKILQNLQEKIESVAAELASRHQTSSFPEVETMVRTSNETADNADEYMHLFLETTFPRPVDVEQVQTEGAITAVEDLVKMHINKQKDDHTTRFLFAASRGDIPVITVMCDQGFDPNSSDYDRRTALMIAAMKGNTETVATLLEYHANPNLVDMNGSSALHEAAKYGHEATMDELMKHGARLVMDEVSAASALCQAVFAGDTLKLRRLLRAGIQVNAGDYGKKTAAHIAAAEGNLAALKTIVEFGADLSVRDRWNNTIEDEAKRANAGHVLEYLNSLKHK